MSRHISKFTTLLIDEIFGSLASEIYQTLLVHGRCTLGALEARTSLETSELRHGLAVLIQNTFVHWRDRRLKEPPAFEANVDAPYNLSRYGKWVQMSEERYSPLAGQIVSKLLFMGHARIPDLIAALSANNVGVSGASSANAGAKLPNGTGIHSLKTNGRILHESDTTIHRIHQSLSDLREAGLISICHPSHFRTYADNRTAAEDVTPKIDSFTQKTKAERQAAWEAAVQQKLDEWRYGTTDERAQMARLHKGPKRQRDDTESSISNKRARLDSGYNGASVIEGNVQGGLDSWSSGLSKSEPAFRVNHIKMTVLFRNRQLVRLAKESLCSATSKIYEKVLSLSENHVRECRDKASHDKSGEIGDEHIQYFTTPYMTTEEVARAVPDSADLKNALGFVGNHASHDEDIDHPKKKRRRNTPQSEEPSKYEAESAGEDEDGQDAISGSDVSSDASFDSDDSDEEMAAAQFNSINGASGHIGLTSHQMMIRSHLLLLAQHPYGFLSHLRETSTGEGWNINFPQIREKLQKHTINQTISSRYGTRSVRLASILAENGKLDEKTLSSMSLIREKDMRNLITPMHQSGLIELQEVPRDNTRIATKTNFLFFFDLDRCISKITGNCYQTMTRLLERVRIEREKVQGVLEKASRSDVVGREERMLNKAEQEALKQWKVTEEKLMGQLGRIDDTVAVLRDF
ncbi:uncharacterized protein KY384_000287 [Bacidia gigantensis]|uniref:uncharacterized protein n=1 Tax=Bacidia gigantensis TaxID=2732470 RepID=UPI001D03D955|nr:uncharacterized protein KY384_000287 [Bacidia gigantensis]KAG8526294.1 hypothetical protein KY384_000287 [Bacidia gigantensis]